jgi:hypothetical protein
MRWHWLYGIRSSWDIGANLRSISMVLEEERFFGKRFRLVNGGLSSTFSRTWLLEPSRVLP